jgi:hypothetical protein
MKTNAIICLLTILIMLCACQQKKETENQAVTSTPPVKELISIQSESIINPDGMTIEERFSTPEGFERSTVAEKSFGAYLRQLPLKPDGAKVHYFDGREKSRAGVYAAVVDLDLDPRNLQQCADAVIRLRGEYLFDQQRYNKINFHFTNGFEASYKKWTEGYRIKVDGRNVSWYPTNRAGNSYKIFRQYLKMVFAYAGTISLNQELKPKALEDIEIGDVFIQAGSPGHAVIVVDLAKHPDTGEKRFLLAQSYMPAQDIQVLRNPANEPENPWYSNQIIAQLRTPEWTFNKTDLKSY